MSGKAGPFVGLKHAITKGVLLGDREVGLDVRLFDVIVLGIGMRVGRAGGRWSTWNQVCPVHLSAVVHRNERGVRMADVVILRTGAGRAQIDGPQRNGLASRIQAAGSDVGAPIMRTMPAFCGGSGKRQR